MRPPFVMQPRARFRVPERNLERPVMLKVRRFSMHLFPRRGTLRPVRHRCHHLRFGLFTQTVMKLHAHGSVRRLRHRCGARGNGSRPSTCSRWGSRCRWSLTFARRFSLKRLVFGAGLLPGGFRGRSLRSVFAAVAARCCRPSPRHYTAARAVGGYDAFSLGERTGTAMGIGGIALGVRAQYRAAYRRCAAGSWDGAASTSYLRAFSPCCGSPTQFW